MVAGSSQYRYIYHGVDNDYRITTCLTSSFIIFTNKYQ